MKDEQTLSFISLLYIFCSIDIIFQLGFLKGGLFPVNWTGDFSQESQVTYLTLLPFSFGKVV